MSGPRQLALFGAPEPEPPRHDPARDTGLLALAARQPDGLRLGTCSWSFPGWQGIVYPSHHPAPRVADLARDGLAEYARHPLLRTVEIDRSFYAPVPEVDLRRYASQVPAGFRCCLKAPGAVTSLALPQWGAAPTTPRRNPDFLSLERFEQDLLDPCRRALAGHVGPIVLEFPRGSAALRLTPEQFAQALERFLARLPREFEYAVELRERALLTRAYRDVLARQRVAHAYTYWSGMPSVAEQARRVPPESAPFVLLRLLLKPGRRYEDERARFAPFDKLVEPDDGMRAEVAGVARAALARGQAVWVLANNKAEGSAPLTLFALAELLAAG